MKLNIFANSVLLTSVIALALNLPAENLQAETKPEFICAESFDRESQTYLPTTFAWTTRGKIAIVRWQTEYFGSHNPERRCQEVSPRFQEAYDNNTLGLITNGTINNQPVICTAKEAGGDCHTLLLTLRPQDNSLQVLSQLRRIFNSEQVGPVKHSSGTPQVYYQFDIEKFIRTAPVE